MTSNLLLKEQLAQTVDTYVKYIDVDTGATVRFLNCIPADMQNNVPNLLQDKKINEEVDTLLRKLDEFEQLLMLSQSDANVCLFKHVPGLQNKFGEMQSVFDKIDR